MGNREKKCPDSRLKQSDSRNVVGLRRPDEKHVLDEEVLLKLRVRALKHGKIKNRRTAHEFTDWITLQWLEGKAQHQTIDQSYRDFLRTFEGVERGEAIEKRKATNHRNTKMPTLSVNERFFSGWIEQSDSSKRNPKREISNDETILAIPDPRVNHTRATGEKHNDLERLLSKLHRHLTDQEVLMCRLIINWGFTQVELGKIFGVHETRITQVFSDLTKRIEKLKIQYNIK